MNIITKLDIARNVRHGALLSEVRRAMDAFDIECSENDSAGASLSLGELPRRVVTAAVGVNIAPGETIPIRRWRPALPVRVQWAYHPVDVGKALFVYENHLSMR